MIRESPPSPPPTPLRIDLTLKTLKTPTTRGFRCVSLRRKVHPVACGCVRARAQEIAYSRESHYHELSRIRAREGASPLPAGLPRSNVTVANLARLGSLRYTGERGGGKHRRATRARGIGSLRSPLKLVLFLVHFPRGFLGAGRALISMPRLQITAAADMPFRTFLSVRWYRGDRLGRRWLETGFCCNRVTMISSFARA